MINKETACRIAKNYLDCEMGIEVTDAYVKSQEPGNGKITVRATEAEQTYEVIIDPVVNTISARQVLHDGTLNDYRQDETALSQLAEGQCFKIAGDCIIYEYHGTTEASGAIRHMVSRKGKSNYFYMCDTTVYPLQ